MSSETSPLPSDQPSGDAPEGDVQEKVSITVQTKSGVFNVDCLPGDNILYAGLKSGLTLPYECATGTCGTCRCRVMEGSAQLDWEEAPGLAYVKRERNESLMCQAKATADCTIRVPAQVTQTDGHPDYFSGKMQGLELLTHDVVRFSVALDKPMSFDAGQFVVLESPEVPGGRAYSMTNHGERLTTLDFVVKRKPGGGFSNWLFEGAPDGVEIKLFGPLGRATFDAEEKKNLLCVAGGSGIAGMMAILESGISSGHFAEHRADIFFGVRTAKDIFFGEELNRYAERFPDNITVTIALSDEEADAAVLAQYASLQFANGFVHSITSSHMKDRYDNVVGYIAGPPPMVDGALRILVLEGRLPGPDIRYDKFG